MTCYTASPKQATAIEVPLTSCDRWFPAKTKDATSADGALRGYVETDSSQHRNAGQSGLHPKERAGDSPITLRLGVLPSSFVGRRLSDPTAGSAEDANPDSGLGLKSLNAIT